MVDIKDKISWIRMLILGLVVTLASSTASSLISSVPYLGGIVTFNAVVGSSLVVGLLAMLTLYAMDQVKALQE